MYYIIPNLHKQIIKYFILPKWKLLKCIKDSNMKIMDISLLCSNINAVNYMKDVYKLYEEFEKLKNKLKKYNICNIHDNIIDWKRMMLNKNMIKYIKKHSDFNIEYICENENAVKFILNMYTNEYFYEILPNKNMISFINKIFNDYNAYNYNNIWISVNLSKNINAYKILNNNKHFISWDDVSGNIGLMKLIEKEITESETENRPCKVNYNILMSNRNAIDIIKKYIKNNKLSNEQLGYLEYNSHPDVLDMLDNKFDKFRWISKHGNKSQISNNINKLNRDLSTNKNIFEIDKMLYKKVSKLFYDLL